MKWRGVILNLLHKQGFKNKEQASIPGSCPGRDSVKPYRITRCLLGPWLSCFAAAPQLRDRCVWARDAISPANSNEVANQARWRDGQHAAHRANGRHWSVCVLSLYTAFRSIRLLTETERDGVVLNTWRGLLFFFTTSEKAQWDWPDFDLSPCSPRKQVTLPLGVFLTIHRRSNTLEFVC